MSKNNNGFVMLLMFVILTLCASLVSLFITRGTIYRYTITYFLADQDMKMQLQNGVSIAQELITPATITSNDAAASQSPEQTLLKKLLLARLKKVRPAMLGDDDEDATYNMMLSVQVESGKINLNSLYDFTNKKFVNEGDSSGDRKKLCEWLFNRIAQTQGGVSLFEPFASFLAKRSYPLNDVTELLTIPEFAECFNDTVYFIPQTAIGSGQKLYLTDLFTVVSETDTLQPWVLSPSLILLFGGSVNIVTTDTLQEILQNFSVQTDWQQSWDETIKNLYGIKFDNLPEEVKSILTSQFEATIFSISLNVHDQNRKASLYALLKKKTEENGLSTYDILRMYQI